MLPLKQFFESWISDMIGLGTIINVAAIIVGGLIGLLFGRGLKERWSDALGRTCGIATMFIGGAGAVAGMLTVAADGTVTSGRSMLLVISLVLGTCIGEVLNIDSWFTHFGEWLKVKTHSTGDRGFVNGFVTASLTVSIGAMAIVGSILDGIFGDWSVLATKAVLDLIIVLVMTCSMGKGCIFSAIPVGVFQGVMTLLARLVSPLMTPAARANLSMVGSVLIFCVGMNLVREQKLRVANMLPALVLAVAAAFLPFEL